MGKTIAIVVLALVMVLSGLAGAACLFLEREHVGHVKAAMQAAADSTALMLTKDARSLTPVQLQDKAERYFDALFSRPDVKDIQIKAHTSAEGSIVTMTASTTVKPRLIPWLSASQVDVDVQVKGNTITR